MHFNSHPLSREKKIEYLNDLLEEFECFRALSRLTRDVTRSDTSPLQRGTTGNERGDEGGGGRTRDDGWWTMIVHRDARVRDGACE